MATFFTNLIQSIFTPGPTPSLIVATNVSFACLQIVLFLLLIATYSVHFVVLSGLSAGLWWAINWFVRELGEVRRREELTEGKRSDEGGEDSTDAETVVDNDVKDGDLRRRQEVKPAAPDNGNGGSSEKSEISTEDEWEKVDESEKDK